MSRQGRWEYLKAIYPRYQAAARAEKQRILDEFCQVTRYHRKSALRLLHGPPPARRPPAPRRRPPTYETRLTRLRFGCRSRSGFGRFARGQAPTLWVCAGGWRRQCVCAGCSENRHGQHPESEANPRAEYAPDQKVFHVPFFSSTASMADASIAEGTDPV